MECLIVRDGPLEAVPLWLMGPGVRVIATGRRSGPAVARNLGAKEATGDVLVFVDADVELHPRTLGQFRQAFANDPDLDAIFGSYDDGPAAPGVVSRYRNLLHHHTHHQHGGPACTFWAGCGAMRRSRFLELGGFDSSYDRPSIEDVDLGLRLWRAGGRILLDPSIQGCHHKAWTLASMVKTDIADRAIPWSRLILERGDNPATLNLSLAGRLSGGVALLVPLGLALALLPGNRAGGLALAALAELLLILLNLPFHRLHWRRCGPAEGIAGVGLHLLHLCSASGTFILMACHHLLQRPITCPEALRKRPKLQKSLVRLALGALALAILLVCIKGLVLGWSNAKDLRVRQIEWNLFSRGVFPLGGFYRGHPPPGLVSSPYPAWALPMFGLFFYPWGLKQGILIVQILSLLALAFIGWIGFHSMRPHGKVASWFGALGPLAISGNANALAVAQFSILCVALLLLQWHLLQRKRFIAAGVSWALAMIKPQIALFHGTAFLTKKVNRKGLLTGVGILTLLASIALIRTQISPFRYAVLFLDVLGKVQDDGGWNIALQLSRFSSAFVALLTLVILGSIFAAYRLLPLQQWKIQAQAALSDPNRWMLQAGLYSLLGFLTFYHRNTDHIMLAPALLALGDLTWKQRRLGITALAILLGASLWIPASLVVLFPTLYLLQLGIWSLCTLVLTLSCWRAREPEFGA